MSMDEEGQQHWIQCDACSKWRRVPQSVVEAVGEDDEWLCSNNPDPRFASCTAPQEMTDQEIDLDLQQAAALAAAQAPPSPGARRPPSRQGGGGGGAPAAPPGAKLPAVWQLISDNIFSHRKRKVQDEDDIMVCQCPPTWRGGDGCGPNCLNRMLCIECTEDFCPCENHCTNQSFSRKQYAKLSVRRAGPKGFGLFTEQPLKAGQFIIEYIGEVLEEEEYQRRKDYYNSTGQRHYYFMNVGNGEVIDACRKGNQARFINHSCDPNCETQKWLVRGELAIGLFALTDVAAGEELTFDYNFERYGDKPMRCYCGTAKCRKFIGGTQESTADIQAVVEMEDVTRDPEPVMVHAGEVDTAVQAMLDKEVGASARGWDDKLLKKLQQLCKNKGIDWSLEQAKAAAAAASAAAAAASAASGRSEEAPGGGGDEEMEEEVEEEVVEEEEQSAPSARPGKQQQKQQAKGAKARAKKPSAAAEKQRLRRKQRVDSSDEDYSATGSSDSGEEEGDSSGSEDGAGSPADEAADGEEPRAAALKRKRALAAAAARQRKGGASRRGGRGSDEDMEDAGDEDGGSAGLASLPPRKRLRAVGAGAARGRAAASDDDIARPAGGAKPRRALALLPSMVNVQWRPTFKKRSEVDRRLEGLVNKGTGRLRDQTQDTVIKVLRMFNLCDITPRNPSGVTSPPMAAASPRGVEEQGGAAGLPPPLQQQQQKERDEGATPKAEQQQQPAEGEGAKGDGAPPPPPAPEAAAGSSGAAPSPAAAPADDGQKQQQPTAAAATPGQQQAAQMTPQQQAAADAERERESEARFKARQRARMHDLGMILDVVLATTSDRVKREWVSCGLLTQLQATLGRIPFTQDYAVVLVKAALVLDHLPLTADDLYQARSAHGTFADLLRRMASTAQDWEVRRRAHKLLRRFPASSCTDATLAQLHSLQGPGGKPYLLSLHLPAPQLSRVLASLPAAVRQQAPRGRRWRWGGPGGAFGGRGGPPPFGGPPFGGPPFPPHGGPPPPHMQQQPGGPQDAPSSPSSSAGGAAVNGEGIEGMGRGPGPSPGGPMPPMGGRGGGPGRPPMGWRGGDWGPPGGPPRMGGGFGQMPPGADAPPQLMAGNRPLNRAGDGALDGWDTSGLDGGGGDGFGRGPPRGAVLRHNRAMRSLAPGGPLPPRGGEDWGLDGPGRWGHGLPPRPGSPPRQRGGPPIVDLDGGPPPSGGGLAIPIVDLDEMGPSGPAAGPPPQQQRWGQQQQQQGRRPLPAGPCGVEDLFAAGVYAGFGIPVGGALNGHGPDPGDGRMSPVLVGPDGGPPTGGRGGPRGSPPPPMRGGGGLPARASSSDFGRYASQEYPPRGGPGGWPGPPGGGGGGGPPIVDLGPAPSGPFDADWGALAQAPSGAGPLAALEFPESWDAPDASFELFVGETVKRRLGKYVQPDHPNRITKEEAQMLYRKLKREVVEKEGQAYTERSRSGAFAPIERAKLEANVKEFVRLSIRRLRAPM